ncbi:MAG: biotin transporter BioY [Bacteroidetes bacterium]|nr:biotin transporter BioY [Bacteroidota bacterium]
MEQTLSLTKTEQYSALTQLGLTTGFAALTAVGAQIEIPAVPIPFTLQTFFVLLAGATLGKRNGAISQLLYLLVGVSGMPVFSGAGFGLAKILGPTGGYLLAFPLVAFLTGFLVEYSQKYLWILFSMFASLLVLFSVGTLHLHLFYLRNFSEAVEKGFLLFTVWDFVKLFSAAGIAHQILRWKKSKQ